MQNLWNERFDTPGQIPLCTGGPKNPDMMLTLDMLEKRFQGFEMLLAEEIERDIIEGCIHTGRSAVVHCVIRKPF